jgi:peptidoglycan-associated lipoprotein
LFSRLSLAALNASQPLGDAFFEYDQATLSEDARKALERDAAWLKQWSSTRIMIEGHADERGTSEYNLALGDSRAKVVRGYLVSLGVAESRVALVSKGEEQPFCAMSTADCWQLNRRAHFVITAK